MKQPDLICTVCELSECDENSLFCIFRFLTKPNAAQKEFLPESKATRRQKYDKAYYIANRDRKLKEANARNQAKRF